jgi:predicted DNA-binding antitoxin AbrB/MazE fold protein
MKIKAIYEDKVLKPLNDLSLPEKSEIRLTIKRSFSDLLDELGEPEAKKDIDFILGSMRQRRFEISSYHYHKAD